MCSAVICYCTNKFDPGCIFGIYTRVCKEDKQKLVNSNLQLTHLLLNMHSASPHERDCRADNITSTDCSGRGRCVGGLCKCDMRINPEEFISGKYCECDNFSCTNEHGLLCSEPESEFCECGRCICRPGWSGISLCTCDNSNDTCMPPDRGLICSGRGKCICGTCECDKRNNVEEIISGRYCECDNFSCERNQGLQCGGADRGTCECGHCVRKTRPDLA